MKGIDASKYQGTIDWPMAVKSGEVEFALLKVGNVTRSKGEVIDPQFKTNIEEAIANGTPVGVYWYSYALEERYIYDEVNFVLNTIEPYREYIKWPVVFDIEWAKQAALGREKCTKFAQLATNLIRNAGYIPMLYSYKYFIQNYLDLTQINADLWLAHFVSKTDYNGYYTIWQYTSNGQIDGIPERVDKNIAYKDYGQFVETDNIIEKRTEELEGVKLMQSALNDLGYDCGEIDGIAGKRTTTALKLFQMENGLITDGIYGPKTAAKFNERLETPINSLLKVGCEGTEVRSLQAILNRDGYSVGEIDGIYGPKTFTAVEAFQTSVSIEVDGIVGKITLAKLLAK